MNCLNLNVQRLHEKSNCCRDSVKELTVKTNIINLSRLLSFFSLFPLSLSVCTCTCTMDTLTHLQVTMVIVFHWSFANSAILLTRHAVGKRERRCFPFFAASTPLTRNPVALLSSALLHLAAFLRLNLPSLTHPLLISLSLYLQFRHTEWKQWHHCILLCKRRRQTLPCHPADFLLRLQLSDTDD